ncbi:efflux RND transporter periplasmic adaptor subunit [Pelomonas sp. SE-A7]|uniref:efflux RND transporter periplasmic adaptor subunit n=1 Tax=Pelomonas sp. SE-A7 TaxID=3054953 RepID=UPI00259CE0C4|nr:efflux RND transporter periplasmic adaptor subunit [Pelomonas sp. SE-A7]MDM4765562.1 efflux RND transporter periplasmic adaptor subunit [Pelomonas sp. SE-A7]
MNNENKNGKARAKPGLLRRWRGRLIIAGLLLAGLGFWAWKRKPVEPPPPPTGAVAVADVIQVVQAAGVLQAQTKVDVGAQVSGQVRKIHVQLGQNVKKGDLLVSIDPELARNDVAQAEALLKQQEAQLESNKIGLAMARREAERQHRLLAGNASTPIEVEQADNSVVRMEADLRGQAASLTRLQADLEKKKLSLGYTSITAPMDGMVVNLPVQEGQTVIAIQTTPVMLTLAQLDQMTVRTRVPEADIQLVQLGQTARFTTLAGEAKRYEGKVRVVQPIPERVGNAVFYNVLFEVDNQARKLFSDMTVQVEIVTGSVSKVPTLPIAALGERDAEGRYTVHVVDAAGKNPQPRKVKVGLQDGSKVQVLDGLKLGEKLLLAPPSAASGAAVVLNID